jgi:GDP-L-fucose synthase
MDFTQYKVFVAGHRGLVGSALCRCLTKGGYQHIIVRSHSELDLLDPAAVNAFFHSERPDLVYLAAARVGGIYANSTYPVEFLLDNLKVQNNVIEAAWRYGVQKLLFLGSSCIYPKLAPQPLKEEYLLTSPLEPTNEPYAIAKIAGIKLCGAMNRQYGTIGRPVHCNCMGNRYAPPRVHVRRRYGRRVHISGGKFCCQGSQ